MKLRWVIRIFIGVVLFALYELFLDGSGVGIKERLNGLKDWADK